MADDLDGVGRRLARRAFQYSPVRPKRTTDASTAAVDAGRKYVVLEATGAFEVSAADGVVVTLDDGVAEAVVEVAHQFSDRRLWEAFQQRWPDPSVREK